MHCGPLQRTFFSTACPCQQWSRSWSLLVRNLCSQVASFRPALSTRLASSSDVGKQECAENRSSLLAMNLHNFCQGWRPGKLYLGSVNFCFVIFSSGHLWAICHSGFTPVGKKSLKTISNIYRSTAVPIPAFFLQSFKYLYLRFYKHAGFKTCKYFTTVWEITEQGLSFPEFFLLG